MLIYQPFWGFSIFHTLYNNVFSPIYLGGLFI
jgi:hypothetical protein